MFWRCACCVIREAPLSSSVLGVKNISVEYWYNIVICYISKPTTKVLLSTTASHPPCITLTQACTNLFTCLPSSQLGIHAICIMPRHCLYRLPWWFCLRPRGLQRHRICTRLWCFTRLIKSYISFVDITEHVVRLELLRCAIVTVIRNGIDSCQVWENIIVSISLQKSHQQQQI